MSGVIPSGIACNSRRPGSAQAVIAQIDRARENYIQRFAGVSRYDARNYDLCISADGHSEEELAELILAYIQPR